MNHLTEIVLHTKEGFIIRVENAELKNKFFSSPYSKLVDNCPLENLIKFIDEVMECQVPTQSREQLQQILTDSGFPEHQQSA